MNKTIEDIFSRRSIKKYSDRKVSSEDLKLIAEAGIWAPSGSNSQKTISVVIQDKQLYTRLERLNASVVGGDPDTRHNFYGADAVILVLADGRDSNCVANGALVMENMMLAAHSLGLGSCWINRARETFETEEGRSLLREWGIDENYIGVGYCIIGYPEGDIPQPRARKEGRIIFK